MVRSTRDSLEQGAHLVFAPCMHQDNAMACKRKPSRDSKTQIGSFMPVMLIPALGLVLLVGGCVPARQIQKTRDDAAIYGEQQRARAVRERCIDGGAMPGTTAYLECQLKSK